MIVAAAPLSQSTNSIAFIQSYRGLPGRPTPPMPARTPPQRAHYLFGATLKAAGMIKLGSGIAATGGPRRRRSYAAKANCAVASTANTSARAFDYRQVSTAWLSQTGIDALGKCRSIGIAQGFPDGTPCATADEMSRCFDNIGNNQLTRRWHPKHIRRNQRSASRVRAWTGRHGATVFHVIPDCPASLPCLPD